jgi:Fe2+ or Zn2+ uptake regulation protein
VADLGEAYIGPMAERIRRERGFQVDDARLDFYGQCADCRAAAVAGA